MGQSPHWKAQHLFECWVAKNARNLPKGRKLAKRFQESRVRSTPRQPKSETVLRKEQEVILRTVALQKSLPLTREEKPSNNRLLLCKPDVKPEQMAANNPRADPQQSHPHRDHLEKQLEFSPRKEVPTHQEKDLEVLENSQERNRWTFEPKSRFISVRPTQQQRRLLFGQRNPKRLPTKHHNLRHYGRIHPC